MRLSCTNHVYPTPRGWIGEETLGCQRNKSSSGCANDCKISRGRGFMENLSFSHNHRHQVPIHKLSSWSTWKVLLEQNQKLQPLGLCSRPLSPRLSFFTCGQLIFHCSCNSGIKGQHLLPPESKAKDTGSFWRFSSSWRWCPHNIQASDPHTGDQRLIPAKQLKLKYPFNDTQAQSKWLTLLCLPSLKWELVIKYSTISFKLKNPSRELPGHSLLFKTRCPSNQVSKDYFVFFCL